jgi:hypothetical protein
MWRRVYFVWTDVSEAAAICSRWFVARGFLYPEDGGDTFLRNVSSHKIYTAPYPRKRHSSYSPLWKRQILHGIIKSTVFNLSDFPCLCHSFSVFYFDFSNAFDILPRAMLHHKPSNYGLSSCYLNRFLSYLTNRQSHVCYSVTLPSPFVVQSGVPQWSVSAPSLFNIIKNDLWPN